MSRQVITFTIAHLNLAVDIESVDRLSTYTKKKSKRGATSIRYGEYVDGSTICMAVELLGKVKLGTKCPMLMLPVGSRMIPLAISSVGALETVEQIQEMPMYKDLEVSGIFDSAFVSRGQVYYLLNTFELSRYVELPALAAEKQVEEVSREDQFEINTSSKNWLPYFLAINLSRKNSGALILKKGRAVASMGFTAGHITYAKYRERMGLDALKAIYQASWGNCVWSDEEVNALSNIDGTSDQLLSEIKG